MAHWFAVAGICVAALALLGSIYILGFALWGVILGRRKPITFQLEKLPDFLVLIPAHNEATGIEPTLSSVLKQNYPRQNFRVITIADNCTDATATVAAQFGSEVWERHDTQNRGKGQALGWALERAKDIPFDTVLILDADSTLDPEFLRQMANAMAVFPAGSVLLARDEFLPSENQGTGWFETLTLASRTAENSFVYRPRSAGGLVNLIMGNCFCIPRETLSRVPFGADSVVEDAEYAISLALAGVPVHIFEPARVWSRMTQTVHDAAPQRIRWARGIFQLIFRSAPKLFFNGLRQGRWRWMEAAIMLLLTSRVLLATVTMLPFVIAAFTISQPQARIILMLAVPAVLLQAIYLYLMFRKSSNPPFSMRGLLFMPAYIAVVSFSQAMALFGLRRKRWARTVR